MRQVLRLVLLLALTLASACTSTEKDVLPNVRLGMAPRDVRDRFVPGGEGSWQTALGAGDDTVLEWTSRDPKSPVVSARFEFHLGMLVAIRAQMKERIAALHVTTTPKTVTVHAPAQSGEGTRVMVLARDCPTHKDEAESFATHAAPR